MLKPRRANSVACRATLLASLALSTAALSSCLLNVYLFAVVNKSRSPVEAQYTFKDRGRPCREHAPPVRPAGTETDQGVGGRPLRGGPGPLNEYERFPIESLRVRGPGGLAHYEGRQLTHHFEDLGRGVFALTYADRKEE